VAAVQNRQQNLRHLSPFVFKTKQKLRKERTHFFWGMLEIGVHAEQGLARDGLVEPVNHSRRKTTFLKNKKQSQLGLKAFLF
jgi:hypothetical protein